ncbi:right-handed parallel beta-helix repeat-containing protein [Myxococcota bacterium]|nr:right-handed parallel beta-helix repeat-containing protein [Myxococcota bacterium]MBU1535849.1 right-handed parallel beta-helix repeat-containing protein [Myxococcota bacterium]
MKYIPCCLLIFLALSITSCSNNESNGTGPIYEPDAEDLDDDGLPRRGFEVQVPVITGTEEYIIDLAQWDIPDTGTDATRTTANLQAAVDWAHDEGYTRVVLPEGNYLVSEDVNDIYQGGIDIYGDTEFVFSEGAVLTMDTNDKWNYCVLRLNGDNIVVRDGVIVGDRDTHVFTPRENDGGTAHDEGHGICVWGNSNVLIDNMEIKDLTGDGALVLDATDITFTNNMIFNNRRQGISIVGGVRIAVQDNEIHHINGTAPQFGIDIEGPGRVDEDILIQNNNFHHNAGGDIVNATGENVYILDNVMEQGEGSTYTDGPIVSWHKTHNIIARNTITMVDGSANGRLGYIQYSGGGDKGHNRATYVHENVCNSCGMYMYKSSQADVRRNQFLGYFMAFSEFVNVILIDNLVTYSEDHPNLRYCWSYRFNDVTGFASGNLLGEDLEEIPLSETEPYTLQCVLDGW